MPSSTGSNAGETMNLAELNKVAEAMVAPGKGILAADESTGTIKKRFDAIGVESTEDNRRDYREMLFRAAEAMKNYISGVILYDETIWQKAKDGTPLVEIIEKAGSIPGIKVDKGAKPLPGCPGETITEGLDACRAAAEYYELGARFAKWRAVIDIGDGIPTYDRDPRQRPCAGPLRRALPGSADRADRRARSADGRRPRHRPLRTRSPTGCCKTHVPGALLAARRARRHGAEAQHGRSPARSAPKHAGVEEVAENTVKMLKALRAGRRAGHRLPLGRPVRRGGHRASRRHEPDRRPALEPDLLLRPRPAGRAAEGLGRQARERRRRAARLRPPRPDERPRLARPVEAGPGKKAA